MGAENHISCDNIMKCALRGRQKINEHGFQNIKYLTSLTLGLQVIKNPGVLERRLTQLGSLLFVLLNGTLINTTTLVIIYITIKIKRGKDYLSDYEMIL